MVRLKKAHGDSILLSEKLVDVINLEPLLRGKNRSKAAEILSKIIDVMKDLMQLVEKHNISEKYGDAIKQIFKLLGDNRIAKCLSLSCDQELQDSKIWEGLITVYEMKMKVKQRKLLIENHRTSRDQ